MEKDNKKVIGKVIGTRINAALAQNNCKQKDLAAHLGVPDNTISYFCSGSRVPNAEQIIKISKYLNVSADYLLGISNEPTNDMKLQGVCAYTGLSENAIKHFHNDFPEVLDIYNAFDLSSSYKGELGKKIISQNNKSPSETLQDVLNWMIYSCYFERIAIQLSDLARLSAVFKKNDSEELDRFPMDEIYSLEGSCDLVRYKLVKLSEEMANEFDQRSKKAGEK